MSTRSIAETQSLLKTGALHTAILNSTNILKVLIVDDDPDDVELIAASMLELAGTVKTYRYLDEEEAAEQEKAAAAKGGR